MSHWLIGLNIESYESLVDRVELYNLSPIFGVFGFIVYNKTLTKKSHEE